jgi:protein TonB
MMHARFATPQSLAPSLRAVGPNLYLRERAFLLMIALAFVIHLLVLGMLDLLPEKQVTTIPIRSLSFKIGDASKAQAPIAPTLTATMPVAPTSATAPAPTPTPASGWRVEQKPAATPQKKPEAAKKTTPPKPAPTPAKPAPARTVPVTQSAPSLAPPPEKRQVPEENSSFFDFLNPKKSQETVAQETPRRYVRSYGTAPPVNTLTEKANATFAPSDAVTTVSGNLTSPHDREQEIRARYEQTLSAWIQEHRIYPASARGREGRVVVRVRIDRQGYVRYYALEESAGTDALDRAAVDMIRRANPVPAIPADYPAGNLIEFLIPITFEAP